MDERDWTDHALSGRRSDSARLNNHGSLTD
jgi:hypothetical protein